jgi:hypothetical protein
LVRRPLIGLFYHPRMMDDDDGDECGAVGGMIIGRGNRSILRKPAPMPHCLPQTLHILKGHRTQVALVESRQIITEFLFIPVLTHYSVAYRLVATR